MTQVRNISLLMGVLSLILVALVALGVWLSVAIPRQQSPEVAPSNLAAAVRSASSCESLRAVCSRLAASHDDQFDFVSAQNKMVDRVLVGVVTAVLGWG